MNKNTYLFFLCLFALQGLQAQNNNGQLDALEELGQRETIQIPLPGGGYLSTDIYLPITQDSQMIDIPIFGQTYSLELIPKNTQIVVYPEYIDSTGQRQPNPNPYQLPLLFSRTPYKKNSIQPGGFLVPLLGYAFAFQDVRGRDESTGVYLPMYSDSWQKSPYTTDNHLLDLTSPSDSANGRLHEDGWTTYQYLLNNLQRDFDLDGDGIAETTDLLHNGSLGMAGASAFGIPHLQLAATRPINPQGPGLKAMLSLVATGEHYNCTGYHNGVFRDELIYNWLGDQFRDLDEASVALDSSLQNDLHTPADFGQLTNQAVIDLAADHVSSFQYPSSNVANAYPNSPLRREMDISRAPVNAQGLGDPQGTASRYQNMQLPSYHLTGWYDIFIDGQIRTWQAMRQHTPQPHTLVIGPWAHTSIGSQESGDVLYPANITEPLGLSLDDVNINDPSSLNLSEILQLEPLAFLRYGLNHNGHQKLEEPVFRIPESSRWQQAGALQVRIPSRNYDIELHELLNFAAGQGSLPDLPLQVDLGFGIRQTINVPLPAILGQAIPISSTQPIQPIRQLDFSQVPAFRFYVVGSADSTTQAGNYWMESPDFPPTQNIRFDSFYLHSSGLLDEHKPTSPESPLSYTHDPNNPVQSVGGNNLFLKTPDRSRDSHGQMDYASPDAQAITMNRPDVLQFETDVLSDSISFIGFPKARIFVQSNPLSGPRQTDSDFFVRLLDVSPDGRQLLITEGAVNARARQYARSLYLGQEDDTAPFSNISGDSIYELQFQLLPIAYTLAQGHKLKVLVSSSNYPRYRSNPNLPMQDGEFFRSQPNDGRSYNYQGQNIQARLAENTLFFAPDMPSCIELPSYNRQAATALQNQEAKSDIRVFPNPTKDFLNISCSSCTESLWRIVDLQGRTVKEGRAQGWPLQLDVQQLPPASYMLQIHGEQFIWIKRD